MVPIVRVFAPTPDLPGLYDPLHRELNFHGEGVLAPKNNDWKLAVVEYQARTNFVIYVDGRRFLALIPAAIAPPRGEALGEGGLAAAAECTFKPRCGVTAL